MSYKDHLDNDLDIFYHGSPEKEELHKFFEYLQFRQSPENGLIAASSEDVCLTEHTSYHEP